MILQSTDKSVSNIWNSINMDLKQILSRHSGGMNRNASYISLTTGNSPAVWTMMSKLSIKEMQLIRSLHLELTLEPAVPDSVDHFLIDHIDHHISSLLTSSYTALKYDRNTELGFQHHKKMKSLLQ
jgi:hypothetical protein